MKVFISGNKNKIINADKNSFDVYIHINKTNGCKYNPVEKCWEMPEDKVDEIISILCSFFKIEYIEGNFNGSENNSNNNTKTIYVRYNKDDNTIRMKKLYSGKDSVLSDIFSNKNNTLSFLVSYDPDSYERIIIGIPAAEEAIKILKEKGYEIKYSKSYLNKKEEFFKELPQPNINCSVKMYKHQIVAFNFLKERNAAIIGACMGSGKTLMAISKIKYEKDLGNSIKCLIVCPKIVIRQWENEIHRFFPNTFKTQIIKTGKDELKFDNEIYIINYELLKKFDFSFCNQIIIDESHYIKNTQTERYKNIKNIIKNFKIRILLSGTAVKNNRDELFPQISICLDKNIKDVLKEYKYCTLGNFWVSIQDFYLSMPKYEVLYFLPQKRNEIHFVSGDEVELPTSLGEIQIKKMELAKSKIKYTIEYIKNILELDEETNILVFSEYVEICKEIYEYFKDISIYHDGSFTIDKRDKLKEEFLNDNQKRLFITTRQSLCVGANLVKCNRVVFNDLPWSAADILQAEDRVHRIGQHNSVISTWVINDNSIFDLKIYDIIQNKYKIQKAVLEGRKVCIEDEQYLSKSIVELLGIKK